MVVQAQQLVETMGQQLRTLRRSSVLTQAQLAMRLNYDAKEISRAECGYLETATTVSLLVRACKAIGEDRLYQCPVCTALLHVLALPKEEGRPPQRGFLETLAAEQGWNLKALARRAGVSYSAVRAINRGGHPKMATRLKLARALGRTVESVFPTERERSTIR